MPMLLDIQRKLFARSERVKSLDFHPTEPWLLAGLYSGSVNIWNYETGAIVKTFEVTNVPVRCVKFIARKNWFVAGSDDFQLRCFNYNTHEKVISFEAHPDYIRCLTVHPTGPYVLTGSDDMTIKMWDWDKGWRLVQTFEGHTHYIMNLCFNPKDSNTFASSCLDRTVKVWTLGSSVANFTLDAHDKGVNYVEYFHGGDKPYMLTTGDDRTIKIWDYLSKSCVQTLTGHTSNVSFAVFHPSLPLIVSGSEDGTVKLWHSNTYRLESTLDYGLERVWCVAYKKSGNDVAIGYDEGAVVIKLGKEEPSVSMDAAGKVVWAKNSEVLSANVGASAEESAPDGQRLPVSVREMGTTEVYPQLLQHSPNGRFVTVCGDGEYIIYTALAWRNKAFGSGLGFAWASDSNTYAVHEGGSKVKVFRNFKERAGLLTLAYNVDAIAGGALLAALGTGFVCFYDWETGALVRRVDVEAKAIHWSTTGELVAIVCDDSFYILRFDRDAYAAYLDSGAEVEDDGVETAFEVVTEVSESARTAKWTGECLLYTNSTNRLQYLVGEQTHTITHADSEIYLLGYIPQHGRVYVVNKDLAILSYSLSLALVEYQTAVLRGDLDAAAELLDQVPADQRNRVARFLETQDLKDLALDVATDPEQRFDLAISLDNFETALEIARSGPQVGSESRWRTIGDKALGRCNVALAKECFERAQDLSSMLLVGTSTNDRELLGRLAELAVEKGSTNIAFAAYLQLNDVDSCIEVLEKAGRTPEAALFARTYAPSKVPEIVSKWRGELESTNRHKQSEIAASIADPSKNAASFEEGWKQSLVTEKELRAKMPASRKKVNGLFKADESGLLLVYMEPSDAVSLDEFHEWYDNEHVPLRIDRFDTFRSAVRYAVTSSTATSQSGDSPPKTSWGAFYTVSSNAVFADVSYTSLRSERSAREAELFTRLGMVDRRIYRLEYDSDLDDTLTPSNGNRKIGLTPQLATETAPYLVTNSVDVKLEMQDEYNQWFEKEHVPMLAKVPGWRRSRRFTLLDNGVNGTQAQSSHKDAVPKTLGLHEYDNTSPESTEEFKAAVKTEWRSKVLGPNGCNLLRRERKTCSIYRAWDPIAAIRAEQD
ncbi:hypothetical protein BCV70DRAFT_184348 [Testicularia cyperi]|uniref:Beta'-coat protein n=1 Tax=Testicularia cyperi TaxID=1882483 RepID=A0A317XZN4_9BASI|nr:hypothetical protein BCV70DRAFT_184348 [Testicularia cyperi]